MRRAALLIVVLLAALLLVACGKDEPLTGAGDAGTTTPAETTTTATTTPTTATATTPGTTTTVTAPPRSTNDGCEAVAAPEGSERMRSKPKRQLNRARIYLATMKTNCGTITIRLAVGRAPKTASSFAALAASRFYDGLTFHRIAKPGGNDFVIQGGDPLGTGNGGPGYSVVEAPPRGTRYERYVVAMAKTQTDRPGTSGSQFFIVTAEEAPLPPDYALLGEVVDGRDAVNRIAKLATDPATEMPVDPVVIESVRISSQARS